MEFVEFIELKHSRKSGVGSRETVMSRTTVASNVELLLRWIPAPALDPDLGSAGMTAHTKKSGVRPSFFGFVPFSEFMEFMEFSEFMEFIEFEKIKRID